MDKYEYKLKSEEIQKLIDSESYVEAAEIADTIDWRRVKSAVTLQKIAALYRVNRRNEDSKDILMLAYDRYPTNRSVLYSLCEVAIELDDVVLATEMYKKYVIQAPRDNGVFILRYKILEAQGADLEERIEILEELKKREYQEEWGYELAYLYHRVGLETKCVEECNDIILWFGHGPIVMKAMELKMLHTPLTKVQQQKYDEMKYQQSLEEDNYEYDQYAEDGYDEGQYAEDNYAEGGYGEGQYAEDNYAEGGYGEGQYAEDNYAEGGYGEDQYNNDYQQDNYQSDVYEQKSTDSVNEAENFSSSVYQQKPVDHDLSLYNTINIQKVVADSMKELYEKDKALFDTSRELLQPQHIGDVESDTKVYQQENRFDTSIDQALEESMEEVEEDATNTFSMPEKNPILDRKDTGRIYAEGVMTEWEQLKKDVEEKRQKDIRQKVLQQTGSLLKNFATQSTSGLLEGLDINQESELYFQDDDMVKENSEENIIKEKVDNSVSSIEGIDELCKDTEALEEISETEENIESAEESYEAEENIESAEESYEAEEEIESAEGSYEAEEEVEPAEESYEAEEEVESAEESYEAEEEVESAEGNYEAEEEVESAEESYEAEEEVEPAEGSYESEVTDYTEEVYEVTENDEVEEIEEIEEPAEEITAYMDAINDDNAEEEEEEAILLSMPSDEPEQTYDLQEQESIPLEESYFNEEMQNVIEDDIERKENILQNAKKNLEDVAKLTDTLEEEAIGQRKSSDKIMMDTAEISSIEQRIIETTQKETNPKQEEVRDFTEEEAYLFEDFAQNKKVKKQIVNTLDKISLASYTGNVLITGEPGLGTMDLAKKILREVQATDINFSGKVAKITGDKLNLKNIDQTFEKLNNGALLIEKANGCTEECLYNISRVLQQEERGIIVIMEDTKHNMMQLMKKQALLADFFNLRIDLVEMNNDALVSYAKDYAFEQEYTIDEFGILALCTRISELQAGNHIVTIDDVKDIIDEAIWNSKRIKVSNFVDVLFAKRYDEEDMIVLRERDFI